LCQLQTPSCYSWAEEMEELRTGCWAEMTSDTILFCPIMPPNLLLSRLWVGMTQPMQSLCRQDYPVVVMCWPIFPIVTYPLPPFSLLFPQYFNVFLWRLSMSCSFSLFLLVGTAARRVHSDYLRSLQGTGQLCVVCQCQQVYVWSIETCGRGVLECDSLVRNS
jgi:hypothetical protein